jgi:hypothetical protein
MKQASLLSIGNIRKVKTSLSGILDEAALDRIEEEIESNVSALLDLARGQYRFAAVQSHHNWRQRVSRLYYAAYNGTRAIRLYVSGEYSTDVKDHQKFDRLPSDFPTRSIYVNKFTVLREDRNTADYDHTSRARDLVLGTRESTELIEAFLKDATAYLTARGANL